MFQRSAGTSSMASTPSHSSRQNACGIVAAAGKPAGHADHGDGLATARARQAASLACVCLSR